jgi:1-deoxy-D-xylulose-5-phosphate reductoisomerase
VNADASPTRRIILLGSTGSIGVNTLNVARHLAPAFDIVGLAAGANVGLLIEQAREFGVEHLAIADDDARHALQDALPNATIHGGPNATQDLTESVEADILVGAVVGAAGLPATLSAIERGMTIALANKETLVAAGELVVPLAEQHGVALLPVDSEHSAIFQCLQSEQPRVKRIVLTASGGPFRKATKNQIVNATVAEALNHPTWNMGRKITIDSATMMNKALEIIEAHWLFDVTAEQIDVIIHPQSIAHSFVEFVDHSILAQLGTPDMRTPIQYALTWPDRAPGSSQALDWAALSQLEFEQPDHDRFPALGLAYRVIETGGTSGAVLNAANEAAVDAFLTERIRFGQITELVEAALDEIESIPVDSLETVLEADRRARQVVEKRIAGTTF